MLKTHAFHLKGAARKPLIEAVESFTSQKAVYQGAPRFGYNFFGIGVLDKDGTFHFDCDLQIIMDLVTWLESCGFACDTVESVGVQDAQRQALNCKFTAKAIDDHGGQYDISGTYIQGSGDAYCSPEDSMQSSGMPDTITIEYPMEEFPDDKITNLRNLVAAKATLLKSALGTDSMEIYTADDTLQFPWFQWNGDSKSIKAYTTLIEKLCTAAKDKKYVSVKENVNIVNPKYAMRCFLLSLGFIGDEYKTDRKILLSKLEGSSSKK